MTVVAFILCLIIVLVLIGWLIGFALASLLKMALPVLIVLFAYRCISDFIRAYQANKDKDKY